MKIEFAKSSAAIKVVGVRKPSITGATRFETQPTSIGMLTGLKAPLADPLWMLSRQWQFNEVSRGRRRHAAAHRSRCVARRSTRSAPAPTHNSWPGSRWRPRRADRDARGGEAGMADASASARRGRPARPAQLAPRPRGIARLPALARSTHRPVADQAGLLWSTLFDRRTIDAVAGRGSGAVDRRRGRADGALPRRSGSGRRRGCREGDAGSMVSHGSARCSTKVTRSTHRKQQSHGVCVCAQGRTTWR